MPRSAACSKGQMADVSCADCGDGVARAAFNCSSINFRCLKCGIDISHIMGTDTLSRRRCLFSTAPVLLISFMFQPLSGLKINPGIQLCRLSKSALANELHPKEIKPATQPPYLQRLRPVVLRPCLSTGLPFTASG